MQRYGVILLIGLLIVMTGCRQAEGDDTANLEIDLMVMPDPPVTGDATLIVTVRDGETAINDATVAVRGDMTHAGMVPVLVEASEGTEGEYEIPFEWTMGGDWSVEITATLPDGRSTQRTFDYSLPGSPDDMDMDDMDMSDDDISEMDMDAMSTEDAMDSMDMSDDMTTEEAGE